MTSIALTLLLHTGAWIAGQTPVGAAGRPDVVLRWNEVALHVIRAERTPPPMAARNLAIMHVAVYDAVNAIDRTHTPYAVQAVPEAGTSLEAAAASAAYHTLVALFPPQKALLDRALIETLADVPGGDGRDAGLDLGRFVALKILELRCNDGAARAKVGYALPRAAGLWERTPPRFQEPLYPAWGDVEPFCMKPGTQYRPVGPPPLNSPAYAAAYQEVKELGGRISARRTPEQTQIALFWADNAGTATPPGHWNEIARTVARQRGTSVVENARLFALLNMTLSDAGVLCWVLKFTYGFWRPVTAIHRADEDGNPATEPDPAWEPLIETPPFPSYTSGHSTFSGAAASLLANFFGSDQVAFATTSDGLPGVTRQFPGFWAAAQEAGMSRIYGGIHWQFDNTDGLLTGKTLGTYVFRNYLQPRAGSVTAARPPIIVESRSYRRP